MKSWVIGLLLLSFHCTAFSAWVHLELGATNFGAINTDNVASTYNIVDTQYEHLLNTLDDLIKRRGMVGLFILNDVVLEDLLHVKKHLKVHLATSYPQHRIKIKFLIGHFFDLDLPRADSIHLKNPPWAFFNDLPKHKKFLTNCANRSSEGFIIITYFKQHIIEHAKEMHLDCQILNKDYRPHKYTNGLIDSRFGNVVEFLIKS